MTSQQLNNLNQDNLIGWCILDIEVLVVYIGSLENHKLGSMLTIRKITLLDGDIALTNANMGYVFNEYESSRSIGLRRKGFSCLF